MFTVWLRFCSITVMRVMTVSDHTLATIMIKQNKVSEERLYQKKCLEIVESFLTDQQISCDLLVDKCSYICRNVYNDIVTERALIDLCGYPICPNKLSQSAAKFKDKQKYKIDVTNKKIFEVEDRKQFCSNLCFKSSNYLKEQISEEAIYLRIGRQLPIRLYDKRVASPDDEDLIRRTEELMRPKAIKSNVENKQLLSNQKQKQLIGFPYIKEEYLDQLKDQMNDLKITERK